jgi:hypothetical protein
MRQLLKDDSTSPAISILDLLVGHYLIARQYRRMEMKRVDDAGSIVTFDGVAIAQPPTRIAKAMVVAVKSLIDLDPQYYPREMAGSFAYCFLEEMVVLRALIDDRMGLLAIHREQE